ncbi:putative disease resistance RPP13-like protein 1, partial [Vigna radiata var. radiata]|uniref:Disease resistance RPP13-like protein 1 n=1 Tax=Vigna radiata var. radiata TaxID=3916 RepID=A0A1S3VY22_VIGRR
MAAELVGGALLSAFLQTVFDKMASPQFVDFFLRRKFDEKLLANLNIMLHSINSLAADAEQKQFRDPHVKAWLFAVKEAVFDAEDLLDEIKYELTKCEVEAESQSLTYKLKDCKYCLCLPPLGLLSSLKTLKIIGLDGIVSIGNEFYGSESSSFKSLERLEFYNMKEWEEWDCKTDSFPRLQTLSMNECPKMKGLSEQLLHLKKLIIRSCEILVINEHYMDPSTLKILRIYSCPLTNVPITLYNFLEEMEINGGCDFLTTFPLDLFPKLCSLKL